MTGANISIGLAALLAVMMLAAAISDVRTRTISNGLNASIAALALPYWFAAGLTPWPEMALHFGYAIIIFAVFAGLFFIGAMGGGDVKMIGAVALWIPSGLLLPMLTVMALCGGLLSGGMLIQHRIRKNTGQPEVPYGVAIAIAGFWALHQQYLNHFPAIGTT